MGATGAVRGTELTLPLRGREDRPPALRPAHGPCRCKSSLKRALAVSCGAHACLTQSPVRDVARVAASREPLSRVSVRRRIQVSKGQVLSRVQGRALDKGKPGLCPGSPPKG